MYVEDTPRLRMAEFWLSQFSTEACLKMYKIFREFYQRKYLAYGEYTDFQEYSISFYITIFVFCSLLFFSCLHKYVNCINYK